MSDIRQTTVRIQESLGQIADGSGRTIARGALLESAIKRIRRMVRQEISRNPGIARWEDEDDLVQEVLIRVDRAVQDARPEHVGQFFVLVGQHVRWAAIDLVRKHFGAQGIGRHHQTGITPAREGSTENESDERIDSVRLHEVVDELDDDVRETWILHAYAGLTQDAIATVKDISTRTVQRQIVRAKLRLAELLEPADETVRDQGN